MNEPKLDRRALLSRRDFLRALGAATAVTLVPGVTAAADRSRSGGGADWFTCLDELGEDTREVGRRYLATIRRPPSESELIRNVERRVPGLRRVHPSSSRPRRLLDRAIRRDFGRGDTVRVDGWLLSVTEVELAALAFRRRDRTS